MHLGTNAMSAQFKVAFAAAFPFLEAMGDVIMAWMLLWRAVLASRNLITGAGKKTLTSTKGNLKRLIFHPDYSSRHFGQNGWYCQKQQFGD